MFFRQLPICLRQRPGVPRLVNQVGPAVTIVTGSQAQALRLFNHFLQNGCKAKHKVLVELHVVIPFWLTDGTFLQPLVDLPVQVGRQFQHGLQARNIPRLDIIHADSVPVIVPSRVTQDFSASSSFCRF